MSIPRWNDPSLQAGTMIRGALWLVSEIGEGNVFTKEQVREAFPRVSQADRRIRDLRDYGWVIHTSSDDASLSSDEQRFVKAGVEVWDRQARRQVAAKTISAKARQAAFAADDYQCVICGIAGGESYPDSPDDTAVLSVSRRTIQLPGEQDHEQLVTECKRCRAGADSAEIDDVGRLLTDIKDLDEADRARLLRWMRQERRGATPLDRAWTTYRKLPEQSRTYVLTRLESELTNGQ